MANAFIHLNRELEPLLTDKEYENLDQGLSILFKQTYSKKYTCNECSENCIFDVKEDLPDMILICTNGTLESEKKIDNNELIRFKFELEKNLKNLAEKNGINFNFLPKSQNIVLFGTKKVNSEIYKCFYMNRLVIQNELEQSYILKLKSFCKPDEKALIITPAEFVLDNNSESFLKEQSCELISLKNVLSNDLIINKVGIINETDIIRIAGLYELAIFNNKEVYFQGIKLDIYPQCYDLLCYLAQNANTARLRNDCIISIWGNEAQYKGYDKNLSDTCSLLRKSFKNAKLLKSIPDDFIFTKGGCVKLSLSKDKIFIYY